MATDSIYANSTYTAGTAGNDVINPGSQVGTQISAGNGSDNIRGTSGNDKIQGGKGNDFMFGGAGDDTFLWLAQDIENGTRDKIFDFTGAGAQGGDLLEFRGLGDHSTFTLAHTDNGPSNLPGSKIYTYVLFDSHTGLSQQIIITSLNGQALDTNDFHFYSSVSDGPI